MIKKIKNNKIYNSFLVDYDSKDGLDLKNFENITYRNEKGLVHREDGPAIISKNGKYQAWLINNELLPD